MPSSSRSASRRSAIPSARESRSPFSTFSRMLAIHRPPTLALAMEPDLRDPRDQAEGVGPAVELPQAVRLGVTEAVDDVLPQVRLVLRPGAMARNLPLLSPRERLGGCRAPP